MRKNNLKNKTENYFQVVDYDQLLANDCIESNAAAICDNVEHLTGRHVLEWCDYVSPEARTSQFFEGSNLCLIRAWVVQKNCSSCNNTINE